MVALVLSRIARCASLSLALFFASCSGVRLATPREAEEILFRFLDDGSVEVGEGGVGDTDICMVGDESDR